MNDETTPQGKVDLKPGTLLSPVPAVLVSCRCEGRPPNIISLAWVGTVCSEPPAVAIGVRPTRHSHELILRSGEFVVNLPTAAQAPVIDYCGSHSGREVDKFAAMELEAIPGSVVQAPLIAACPVNLECKVIRHIPLGSHDVFVGQIVAAHADAHVLTQAGTIDPAKANLVAYAAGAYWSLTDPVRRRA